MPNHVYGKCAANTAAVEEVELRGPGMPMGFIHVPMNAAANVHREPLHNPRHGIAAAARVDTETDDSSAYISTVNLIPALSEPAEARLRMRMLYDQDDAAAELLIVSNLRLVVPVAQSHLGFNQPLSDLIQEGNVGLIKAVYGLTAAGDGRICDVAQVVIKRSIREFILHGLRMVQVRLTKSQQELFFRLPESVRSDFQRLQTPALRAVADHLDSRLKEIKHLQSTLAGSEMTLRALKRAESDRVAGMRLQLHSGSVAAWEDREDKEQWFKNMYQAIEKLDHRARDIVCSRWLLQGRRQKLAELARRYGISGERVRKIESESFKFIRKFRDEGAGSDQ